MRGHALVYPHIDIADRFWLRSAILFFEGMRTISTSEISDPYRSEDTKILAEIGYLSPLNCDLDQEILRRVGEKLLSVLTHEDMGFLYYSNDRFVDEDELARMHPSKIAFVLRAQLQRFGTAIAYSGPQTLFEAARGYDPGKFKNLSRRKETAFAYIAALASEFAEKENLVPLCRDYTSLDFSTRAQIDHFLRSNIDSDDKVAGPTLQKGAIINIVFENLKIDPDVPVEKIFLFKQRKADHFLELRATIDELEAKISQSSDGRELVANARALYHSKIHKKLSDLKGDLKDSNISSVFEGFIKMSTVSIPSGSLLATFGGFPPSMLLGAGAFITLCDITVRASFARRKILRNSYVRYLFEIEEKFSPRRMR
jgi:hypothetical protein